MNPTLSKLRKTFTSNWVGSQEGSKHDSLNSLTNPFQLTQSSSTSDQNKRTRFETLLESQRSSEINKSLLAVVSRLEQYDESSKALIGKRMYINFSSRLIYFDISLHNLYFE